MSFVTLFVTSGVNLSFGLFLEPLAAEFGGGRAAVSLAATVNLVLFGAMQPFFGGLIDRVGPRRVMTASVALMSLSALATSRAGTLWHVYVSFGVLGGAAFTGAGILTVAVLVLRWFGERRAMALTLIATGSSLGQAVFYQLAASMIASYGWRAASLAFGVVLAGLAPACAWLVRDDPRELPAVVPGPADRRSPALAPALSGRPFRLLSLGYLACGFTDFMITTHLPMLAIDRGLGLGAGARALSILALANVGGLLIAGRFADRAGNRLTLAALYVVRASGLTLLLFAGGSGGLYLFAFLFGLTFFTTAPLTSALVADLYGRALTGRVLGAVNAVHHLGGAAGAWLAGQAFDLTGSYLLVLAFAAAAVYGAIVVTVRLPETSSRR